MATSNAATPQEFMECPAYTGLTGYQDESVRHNGQRMWVFFFLERDEFVVADTPEQAAELYNADDWSDWITMYAMNKKTAQRAYWDALDQYLLTCGETK